MSIEFNNTTTRRGLVQFYERKIGAPRGFISGNEDRLRDFTADVNIAFDEFWKVALQASGTQQIDDTNHTKWAIVMKNLVSGQRDYQLTTDEQGNQILEVFKVAILPSASATEYQEIDPFDEVNDRDNIIVTNSSTTGTPSRYGKLGNGIFLDTPTGYNATNGLRAFVSREPFYFLYDDTTRKPGVPGILHSWFYIHPAWEHAKTNTLDNVQLLEADVERLEVDIGEYFSRRTKDEKPRLSIRRESNK